MANYDLDGNLIEEETEESKHHLVKIDWTRLDAVDIDESLLEITKNGSKIAIPVSLRTLFRGVISDCIGVFNLDNEYDIKLEVNDRTEFLGITTNDNHEEIMAINPTLTSVSWTDHITNSNWFRGFASFLESKGVKNIDKYKVAEIYILHSIAHEMYHVRQLYQDPQYFAQGLLDNFVAKHAQNNELTAIKSYILSESERSARAFGIRYVREKLKSRKGELSNSEIELTEYFLEYQIAAEKQYSASAKAIKIADNAIKDVNQEDPIESIAKIYAIADEPSRQEILRLTQEKGIDLLEYMKGRSTKK